MLPALDRPRGDGGPGGPLVPLPLEKPKFHHGEARPKRPKKEKPPKRAKRGERQSIGDEDFGQSTLLDDELRGHVNARTIAAASVEMARSKPQQQHRQQRNNDGGTQDGDEDSRLCQELLSKAPHGHNDAFKYWSRSLRLYVAQSHPEEFALIQLKLAQTFYTTAMLGTVVKDVLKSLESCLHHYNICLQLYNPSRYPRRWGLAALEMGMALGAMADLVEREIQRVKPDAEAGTDAVAGFYKEVAVLTNKVEYARGILRRLSGDLGENRELAVFSLEKAIQDYEVLVNDESLKNEGPGSPIDRGPAHAYQLPVRVVSRTSDNNNDIEAEERLPMRLRGVKAAYGRALGTAGKLCLDKHAATVGGNPESAAQAWEHLTKAAEVIPDDTRDRAEALLLLARATIEKSRAAAANVPGRRRLQSPSEALETGIGHLRAALETCPQKQLGLRQELHWNLGRLALARLQGRLRSAADAITSASPFGTANGASAAPSGGRTPLIRLAREAGGHLSEAISLAQAAVEVAATVAAAEARTNLAANGTGAGSGAVGDDGMRAREGWARAELSKLCLTGVAPDYYPAVAIEHLRVAREIHPLDQAPAEYVTSTCLLAKAFHLTGEPERSIQAYREAARAAPLLGNQLHHADMDLNPGAIIPGKVNTGPLASPRRQPYQTNDDGRSTTFMPSLSVALRGLFGSGTARCLDRCREEMVVASKAMRDGGGMASEPSFRTVGTAGTGSVASGLGAAARPSSKHKRVVEWTWVPDQDGTPDNPIVKPSAAEAGRATTTSATDDRDNATVPENVNEAYRAEDLARWKPGQLKELLTNLGLDASGCVEKRDIVDKIMRHPGGPAAAAAAAIARGETVAAAPPSGRPTGEKGGSEAGGLQPGGVGDGDVAMGKTAVVVTTDDDEEQDGFVGMTLADYMGRPTEENSNDHYHDNRGGNGAGRPGGPRGRPTGGSDGAARGGNRMDPHAAASSVSGSAGGGGRGDVSSAASGRGGKVVRLAPAHIAPPSRPAPEWVVDMQRDKVSAPQRKVVINRPFPFSGVISPAAAAARSGNKKRRNRRRSSSGGSGGGCSDDEDDDGIVRAQAHALQAFRFLCRSGQLFLAEQLAISGVWDAGKTGSTDEKDLIAASPRGLASTSANRGGGARSEGLRAAWMATRLKPAARTALAERRERVRQALEDARRFAGAQGAIFLLPRVGVETAAAASTEWDLRAVPSQGEVVKQLRSFEKWLVRGGVWSAQPLLALLTTCGTAAPRGLKAGTGADGSGASTAKPSSEREFVAPSEYPTEEALAEMVDPYEALVCWFYLPDGGSSDVGGGATDGAGGGDGDGGGGGRSGFGQEVACFVAYHDEGKRRPSDDHGAKNGQGGKDAKAVTDLEAKRAAIAARARGRRQQGEDADGGSQYSDSSISSGDGSDGGTSGGGGSDDELDAEDFEPGALRVRVVLASPGTTQQLRKATEAFLKTLRNRNPVKRNVLSAFALQDLSIALGVPKIFKALPPHIQEVTIVQHGLLGVVPVHALPLEEKSTNEPGRPRSAAMGRPPTAGSAGGGRGGGAGLAAPMAVLDRYCVRYTSSLYALEIAERAAAAAIREIPWYFNTCCVVEDPLRHVSSEDGSRDPKARRGSSTGADGGGDDNPMRGQSMGLRHSRHECRVVGATWSSDPDDCHFCKEESATRQTLTSIVSSGGVMAGGQHGRGGGRGTGRGRGTTVGGAMSTATAKTMGGALGKAAAAATPVEIAAAAAANTARLFASKLNQVDAASFLKQLHLRSCGLVVLSRGGFVDDMQSVEDAETMISAGQEVTKRKEGEDIADGDKDDTPRRMETPPLGLAEAFIAVGARTVVQKMWYDEETALVDTVTLLCFYEELKEATLAGEKRPVGVALREAQLWLRGATLTDILSRVQDARGLSPEDAESLMQELSSLFKVMSERGNGAALDRPFSSPYHWAGFQARNTARR
ncbi:tetratricopeptide repeat domain protein [Ectocarpus siliculosus]|uniref:Tetratricopeptide repeat domain protein n=1 Tax=Ectocarpus siliculosus TaxID=2880 RepID=D7FLM2_ECTSI|nr:tetratricopeptide repeat domain protein [Ectocarpus siliculosus]|eukprot:CBJ25838.1 tetratricopeptide repeat domain protein [Ectocarpus siliculosus]